MRQPSTQYVKVGAERVAYQAFGDGATTVLDLKGFLSSVDAVWDHPGHLRIWQAWRQARILMLDHRGAGMSDAVADDRVGILDERIEDVLAVLDEVGANRVAVYGEYDGVLTAIKLAAEYPERVDKVVLANGIACGPLFGQPDEAIGHLVEDVRRKWGTGELTGKASPDLVDQMGDEFVARFERISARPNAAAAFVRTLSTIDVRPLLPLVQPPTLVIYSGDLANTASLAESRELAAQIPDARFFANESSTFYWGGGAMDEAMTFMSGLASAGERELLTLLFVDVVDSSGAVLAQGDKEWHRTLDLLDRLAEDRTSKLFGHVIDSTGDGCLLAFTLPSHAVSAALDLMKRVRSLGLSLRAGVHSGEVERRENGNITGHNVNVAARIMTAAEPGEVVVSGIVASLLGASPNLELHNRGEHEFKGVGRWDVYVVADAPSP